MALEEIRNKKPVDVSKESAINVNCNTFKLIELIKDIYMQGYYDRDWGVGEDEAQNIADTLSITKILNKCIQPVTPNTNK